MAAGCGNSQSAPGGRNRSAAASGTPVEALVVKSRPLADRITTTGTLLANEEVELRSEISGRVTGIFFDEGTRVRKGTVLLKINDQDLQAQLKRKQFEQALASDEERRQKSLLDINGISREEYDKSLNNLNIVKADAELIESQLAKTQVIAPFDGVIGLRYVSEGGYVSPNMLLATMQDIDPMKVEFSVPEKYAARIKRGIGLAVSVSEHPETYDGTVYAVESKVDLNTRTIKARATIPNPDGTLIPGSFAKVEITLAELPDAVLVPSGAVIPRITDEIVYVCRDGKARSVTVKTGIRTDSGTQITQGLVPGDTLIVTGLLQLIDGRAVEIKALQGN